MPLFGPVIRSLRKDVIKALREENERLKAEWEMPCQRCEGYRNERDEARAANEKLRAHAGRVEQRELAALADLDEARAEVKRLEGLILNAEDGPLIQSANALRDEARRIREGRERSECDCDEPSCPRCANPYDLSREGRDGKA